MSIEKAIPERLHFFTSFMVEKGVKGYLFWMLPPLEAELETLLGLPYTRISPALDALPLNSSRQQMAISPADEASAWQLFTAKCSPRMSPADEALSVAPRAAPLTTISAAEEELR